MRIIITSIFLFFWSISTSSMEPRFSQKNIKDSLKTLLSNIKISNDLDTLRLQFYTDRNFRPLWNHQMAVDLLGILKTCQDEGLSPESFEINEIFSLLLQEINRPISPKTELLLTRTFLQYIQNLSQGTKNPEETYSLWAIKQKPTNYREALSDLEKKPNISEIITKYQPKLLNYKRLKAYTSRYHKIAKNGGWPEITKGELMKLGSETHRVLHLKKRLWLSADLPHFEEQSQLFDCETENAVKNFQLRHGLEVNGEVDEATLKALNIPVHAKIATLKANMERLRWHGNSHPKKYIMINIPAFEMKVITANDVSLHMKVAVGKTWRQTPVFNAEMSHIIFNPYWTVPPSILNHDVLPAIKKNTNYLTKLKMDVLSLEGDAVHPDSVDWDAAVKGHFPYLIRQEPGSNNALGKVKFMFPNAFNIYMHDTNHPDVFAKRNRARSSGCIRLAEPMVLAKHLLGNRLPKSITSNNKTYLLKEKIPVFITYQTAFVDSNGILNFRNDIYNKDEKLIQMMAKNCDLNSTIVL